MMKRARHILMIVLGIGFFLFPSWSDAADYGKRLSLSERKRICEELKASRAEKASSATSESTSLGGGIIPDSVLSSIYNTTRQISDSVSLVLVLGHALTCNAVHANKQSITILGVTLLSYPNLPVWVCGAIVYFFGFMLTLSVTFYLVDIAFKLGFAVIMLPIGVALWPFPPTKDKLAILISIILKNAAIFAFLAMTVAYALNLIGKTGGGLEDIFRRIDNNETDTISDNFSLFSSNFLVVVFALSYGMKLIGSTITDYVDKFFQDKAFGRGQAASPIHGSMTQAMDFAKKKVAAPVAAFAGDVAKTHLGKATVVTGKLLSGEYNQKLKNAANYIRNPGENWNRAKANFAEKALARRGRLTGGWAERQLHALRQDSLNKQHQYEEKRRRQERARNIKEAQRNAHPSKLRQFQNNAVNWLNKAQQYCDNKRQNATQSVTDWENKQYQKINAVEDSLLKPINGAEGGVKQWIDDKRQKAFHGLNGNLSRNVNDSMIKAAGKAVVRGGGKAVVASAAGVAKAPTTVLAFAAKLTTVSAATIVGKAPIAVAANISKAPANIFWGGLGKLAGGAKALATPADTARKAIEGAGKATGGLLKNVGDKMQRNKRERYTYGGETEWEREERLKREAEERAQNMKTWE